MPEIPKKMVITSELEKNLIFQNLKKRHIPLYLRCNSIEYRGYIENFNSETMTLVIDSPIIGNVEGEVKVSFAHLNNYHYFTTQSRQVDESHLQLIVPESIRKNILRKYERIDVRGKVFMKFKIMVQSEKTEYQKSSLIDERVIYQEVKKPKPPIDKILNGIKQLVSDFSQGFQVKVFKPDEELSFEEKLLKETGKIFLIYDSYEDTITESRFYDKEILTIAVAYDYLISRGESRSSAESKLLDLLQQKRNKRIFSECMIPLLLEGEVVGYIKLVNDLDYHRSIKPVQAIRASGYATLLVETLVKYDYFRLDSGESFDIPVLNISAGGLLFKLEKSKLIKYVIPDTVLRISIKFPARIIEALGIVFRVDKEKSEYGCKFQEINQEDADYIEDVVKKKILL